VERTHITRSNTNESGFTLVELLVVIAIIGILIGLLLPAINSAREAGRRAACMNKLRQVGLAEVNFEQTYGRFPAGSSKDGPGGIPYNQLVAVLPFMEYKDLYNRFDFRQAPSAAQNSQLATTVVQQFICPSWTGAPIQHNRCTEYGDPEYSMVTCYVGCWGPSPVHHCSVYCSCGQSTTCYCCAVNAQADVGGSNRFVSIFSPEVPRGCKVTEITDGTANTIMGGEQLPDRTPHAYLFYKNGSTAITSAPLAVDLNLCPLNGTPGVNIHSTNDSDTCDGFKSSHPGACNFVMADASVHSWPLTIDYQIYNLLAIKSGRLRMMTPGSQIPTPPN
jgi:prepilin-type N-terminal cleavage/methylation domain-containing protein